MVSRSVPPTALLFVSDFPLSITDSEIESVFQDFGDVISVKSKRDFFVCYAYVEMESVIEGFRAIECLDGLPVRDKVIRCLQIGIRYYYAFALTVCGHLIELLGLLRSSSRL